MDTSQWPQEIIVGKPIEDQSVIRSNNCPKPSIERKIRGQIKDDQGVINCPRCNSINTKFCYYNNYSLTQPRYFCKSCRRYWTEGGSLRNIPVGGGSRKNKRSSPSSNSSISSTSSTPNKILHDHHHHLPQNPKPTIIPHSQDLNLSFPPPSHNRHLIASNNLSEAVVGGGANPIIATSASTTTSDRQVSAMELLTGMTSNSRGVNCFVPMPGIVVPGHHHHPGSVYTTGFPDHDLHDHQFKSSLGFSLDGYGVVLPTEASNGGPGRLMQLPFEDLKQGKDQQGDSSTGYWTGMLGGGSW